MVVVVVVLKIVKYKIFIKYVSLKGIQISATKLVKKTIFYMKRKQTKKLINVMQINVNGKTFAKKSNLHGSHRLDWGYVPLWQIMAYSVVVSASLMMKVSYKENSFSASNYF